MGLTPAQPILPLESNLPLAILATILFLVFSALFAVDNSSQARKLLYAAVASVSVGFGSVYITNAVHVSDMRFTQTLFRLRPACPLYIHPVSDSLALSFSPSPAATPIGTFSQAQKDEFTTAFSTEPDKFEPQPLLKKPDLFIENKAFMPLAQAALKKTIHTCPIFSSMAAVEDKTHFFHIYDLRCPPPIGRIPEVEDILGTVEIDAGKIVPGSYQANTMYRPVSTYGAMMVSQEIARELKNAVEST